MRFYCGIPSECTEEQAKQKFSNILSKIGIKTVFMHCEVVPTTVLERTAEEIDRLEELKPNDANFPLQPNSFYSFTPMDSTLTARHPVKALLERPNKSKPGKVFITVTLPQERDYKDLPIDVQKDIVFYEEIGKKELGWYNKAANIIWFSDIFHYLDNSVRVIPTIVESIQEYNRYGKLAEVLTCGADPEFEIVDKEGNFIEAVSLFGDTNAEIGYDGHSATGELRPAPSKSPLGLTRNIKRLIRKLNSLQCMNGNSVWVGGGINVTTGGHIHFGLKGITTDLKDMLYDLVAEPVLAYQSDRRKSNERGNWERTGGAVTREQPHGTEWRPLQSFIVDETTTAAILSTSYAIVKSWKYHNYIRSAGPARPSDYQAIPLYSAYKTQIDTFVKMFVAKQTPVLLAPRSDIFEKWQIDRINKDFTVDILSSADWLSKFFTPLNVKLKNKVKLEIRFNGDAISTFGIKEKYLDGLKKFADRNYLPKIGYNEKLPRGQYRPLICLPNSWYHMTGKTRFCDEFRAVLKEIILALGGHK